MRMGAIAQELVRLTNEDGSSLDAIANRGPSCCMDHSRKNPCPRFMKSPTKDRKKRSSKLYPL